MVPLGAKALFAMAVLTMAAGAIYGGATQEGDVTSIMVFVAAGALALGVAIILAGADHPVPYAAGAPMTEQSPTGGKPLGASLWPLGAAVGLGLLALGAATNAIEVLAAAVVLLIVGVGWYVQQWLEDSTTTFGYGVRLRDRFMLPVFLPASVFALVGVIAISLSRIFLALSENGTRGVALAVAAVILVSGFIVAASKNMGRTAMTILCVVALSAAVGAGVAGIVKGQRHFDIPHTDPYHGAPPPGINRTINPLTVGQKPAPTTTTAAP